MRPNESWEEVINGKRYSIAKSTLVAHDEYWDGRNLERYGTNTFLYRTPRGNYFLARLTMWQGERNSIEPISQEEALEWWDHLPEKACSFQEAFPGIPLEDA